MNDRPGTYVPLTIAYGIRTSARRTPNKVALRETGTRRVGTLTFAQLVERIDRVANGVSAGLGLRPGQHSAIMAPNCLEFIEIACGLASVGVPPAMVNSRSTPEELAFICNDSEARVLFVHHSLEEVARAATLETVDTIIVIGPEYEAWLAQARAVASDVPIEEWDTFSIPYTAGTTGLPKGVLLPHRSRVLTFFSMSVEYGCYSPEDRALAIAPLYHGAGFAFAVAPIFFGGTCVILPRFDPEETLRLLSDLHLTNTFMVPTHFQAIFSLPDSTLTRCRTPDLKTIISNAAPLSQVMKERIVAHFGEGILFECYGSTEAGIVSNLPPADQLRKQQCVGLPFPCTAVRIVGDDGAEVPPGEVGELFSRSPYIFNGYWNRPEETAKTVRDGWCTAGDLARRDDEGYIYLVDRRNDKIISGGVNIYPREIEEVLVRHPAIAEAVVFGVPDDYWGEAVHAAVVLRPGTSATAGEITAFCTEHLARYKRPRTVDFRDRLPRNSAGKVLRRELRAPFWSGRERRV